MAGVVEPQKVRIAPSRADFEVLPLIPTSLSGADLLDAGYKMRKATCSESDACEIYGLVNMACGGEFQPISETAPNMHANDVLPRAMGLILAKPSCLSNTVLVTSNDHGGRAIGFLTAVDPLS